MPKTTNRGFSIYGEFADTYGSKVKIQQSSSVSKRCWIFVNNDGKTQGSNLKTDGAIHINAAQAKKIIKSLEKFIKA